MAFDMRLLVRGSLPALISIPPIGKDQKKMEPLKLKLCGFAGIASGMGKEDVEIDFSGLPEDARIVALIGPNGAGKSTIMDNMHPYRVMPSRASTPTPTAYSYYGDLVEGADALKELTWTHAGTTYKSVLRLRAAGKSRKQECYLYCRSDAGEFVPYADDSGLVSDGKADTYDRAVEAICGRPDVFFAALFSAQGKRPISAMTVAEVKTLMSAMLGNDDIKALGERALEVVKGLKPHLEAVKAQVLPHQQVLQRGLSLSNDAQRIARDIEASQAELTQAEAAEKAAAAEFTRVELAAGQQETVRAQRDSLTQQLESSEANRRQAIADLEKKQSRERQSLSDGMADLKTTKDAAVKAQADAAQAHQSLQLLVARESSVREAEARRVALRDRLVQLRSRLDDIHVDTQRITELRQATVTLAEQFASGKADGVALAAVIEAARKTAALIDQVPCKGHAFQMRCPLLEQANAAAQGLPSDEQRIIVMREKLQTNKAQRENSAAELTRLLEAENTHRAQSEEIQKVDAELTQARMSAMDLPAIEQAKAKLPEAASRLADTESENRRVDERIANLTSQLAALDQEHATARAGLDAMLSAEVSRVRAMMEALPRLLGEADLEGAKLAAANAERRRVECAGRMSDLLGQRRDVERSLAEVELARVRLTETQAHADRISAEIAQWNLLARALGNDGIVAMSIDDAGPTISGLCNTLLQECYGGRFQIRLSTQQATATGILKESFEVLVEDTLRGEEKCLSDMSGGEKVWINECLVRSMALYMAQSSQQHFLTIFSDEADGPLDEDRKRQFMAMKRAVLERGDYKREYLITQTPQLWELCDATIDVTVL
jgi:exonuclease SbcC